VRSIYRILDADFNRAREALRVLEDLARFHLEDARASGVLKEARHALDVQARPHAREFLAARDSERDPGREGDVPVRSPRGAEEVAAANFKRAREALRSIEELARGRWAGMAREAHRLRYALYGLEKRFAPARMRLAEARLYVLLDPEVTSRPLPRVAEEAARGGADIFQLRQKPVPDVGLARAIRAAVPGALFIVNDRPDVAWASGADGVHVGRGDLPVGEARRLGVGIVGATTHSLAEARRAVAEGADYISVGPMYPTALKPGLAARGFSYLAAARRLGVPVFCIGGITARTVRPEMGRVAVCSAVTAAADPEAAARALRRRLTSGR
jgi:thiamine-phosphate pyrophosphorylase